MHVCVPLQVSVLCTTTGVCTQCNARLCTTTGVCTVHSSNNYYCSQTGELHADTNSSPCSIKTVLITAGTDINRYLTSCAICPRPCAWCSPAPAHTCLVPAVPSAPCSSSCGHHEYSQCTRQTDTDRRQTASLLNAPPRGRRHNKHISLIILNIEASVLCRFKRSW